MPPSLDDIIEHKRREVADRMLDRPLSELQKAVADLPKPRNFFQSVTHPPERRMNLIAEIKKASPSAGLIRDRFNPAELAREYADAGANALSVLTDERFFQGHLDHIAEVRDAVALPVLRKDFIVNAYQLYESRVAGADAVLLIGEVLPTNELIDLQILATELKMTCLIEVHDMETLMRVRDHVIGFPHRSYSLLGINNRDLRTMTTDVATTLRLADLVEDRSVLVSESGIGSKAEAKKLAEVGVRAILVGESLLKAGDIASQVRELLD